MQKFRGGGVAKVTSLFTKFSRYIAKETTNAFVFKNIYLEAMKSNRLSLFYAVLTFRLATSSCIKDEYHSYIPVLLCIDKNM